ncbi:hypothetical protein Trydic_g14926 [Trypoxylus dichotomus]
MIIKTDKIKCPVTSKESVRCKLEVEQRMIEQVNQFKYLGADITISGDLDSEFRKQQMIASRTLGCLKDIVWRNKYPKMKSTARVRSESQEARPDTSKT